MITIQIDPSTHRIVPIEPTEEILTAIGKAYYLLGHIHTNQYKAAISAAPDFASIAAPAAPAQQDDIDYKLMFEQCRTEKAAVVARLKELVPGEFVYPAASAQPAPDMSTESTHAENVSKNAEKTNTLQGELERDAGRPLHRMAKGWQQCPVCDRLHVKLSEDSAFMKAHNAAMKGDQP